VTSYMTHMTHPCVCDETRRREKLRVSAGGELWAAGRACG
jgi:hypothetical protein